MFEPFNFHASLSSIIFVSGEIVFAETAKTELLKRFAQRFFHSGISKKLFKTKKQDAERRGFEPICADLISFISENPLNPRFVRVPFLIFSFNFKTAYKQTSKQANQLTNLMTGALSVSLARAFEALREQARKRSIDIQLDLYVSVSRSCLARTGQAGRLRSSPDQLLTNNNYFIKRFADPGLAEPF